MVLAETKEVGRAGRFSLLSAYRRKTPTSVVKIDGEQVIRPAHRPRMDSRHKTADPVVFIARSATTASPG